jgi:hypothetical protein
VRNREQSSNGKRVALAVGVTVLVIAIEALLTWFQSEARRSADWPTVVGTVTSASVARNPGSSGNSDTFHPAISYRYVVNDLPFKGDRYHAGLGVNVGEEESAEIVAQHPVGSPITIYYDPASPGRSALVPGASHLAVFRWFFRVILVVFAVLAWRDVIQGGAGRTLARRCGSGFGGPGV